MKNSNFFLFLMLFFCTLLSISVDAQCVSGDCSNGRGIFIYPSGAKYIGDFKNGEIHGIGICHYTDGSKYQGNWNYRYPEGKGTKTYADGTVWKGNWKKGKPINERGRFIEESLISKGEANNDGTDIQSGCISGNCQSGQGVFAYPDGSKYEGQFQNRKMDGWGTWYFNNGDKYIGTFANNYANGRGTLYKKSGNKLSGDWVEGEFMGNSFIEKGRIGCIEGNCVDGNGTFIYKNGSAKYMGDFKEAKPEGQGVCYFANGERYRGNWINGAFNGQGILFLNDGREVDGQWVNGVFQGRAPRPNTPKPSTKPSHTASSNTSPARPQTDMKVWAVVVGVASYSHMPALRYTDDDAYRMYAFLKSPEGGALSDDQISILIDEDATKEKITSTMDAVFSKAGANDLIMLYFSGHGLKGSFLPQDFDGFNNKLLHEEINERFRNSRAKYKLCIADACHSGSLLAARSGQLQATLSNYYKSLAQADSGTALIMSSKSEETSLESSGLRQGVFSHFLIRGLKGEADFDNNKIVTVVELYAFVEKNVREYTGYMQSPMITGDFDNNMTVSVRR